MCGVAGYIDFPENNNSSLLNIDEILNSIEHRGPDAKHYHSYNVNNVNVVLGHLRLSIQDLSHSADQPMSNDTKKYHIIYNGEVYNFHEIKAELITKNYNFKTESDTEVVLYAYIEWGAACVNKFIGMFTIVILDEVLGKVIIINDRLGVKPLYIYETENLVLFASELKGLMAYNDFPKLINIEALTQFMKFGYIQAPLCIFQHVRKIEPGTILEYNLATRKKSIFKYWDIIDKIDSSKKDDFKIDELKSILEKSFLYRTVSDVPFVSFLSSGVDSSLVSAVLGDKQKKIETFTIGFNNKVYNEAKKARKIAEHIGTNHKEFYLDENDIIKIVDYLPFCFDEPFADSSMYPTYIICNKASENYKVAISADGGDESFGGYSRYLFFLKFAKIVIMPNFLKKVISFFISSLDRMNFFKFVKLPSIPLKIKKIQNMLGAKNYSEAYEAMNTYVSNKRISSLLVKHKLNNGSFGLFDLIYSRCNSDLLNTAMIIDYKTYLYQILTKIDRTSMANSIEVREPFLDHNIIEKAVNIPSKFKIVKKEKKTILRNILSTFYNINSTFLSKTKKGFSIPIEKWLKGDLENYVQAYLSEESINKSNVFDWKEVEKIKEKFYSRL